MSLIDEVAESETEIFADKSVLKHTHTPDTIIGRDEKLEKITSILLDAREKEKPDTPFVVGPNGVGKTAVTNYVLNEYDNYEDGEAPIQTVRVNCKEYNRTIYIGAKLSNDLLGTDRYNEEHPGVGKGAVWNTVFSAIDDHGGVTLICLDEIDAVDDKDDVLYRLTRAETDSLKQGVVGVVCISTDANVVNTIDDDARSTLSPQIIKFGKYDAGQLRDLLEYRADRAFKDGRVTEGAISYAAAQGKKKGGDARVALDLLRGAGNLAQQEQADQVTDEHVKREYDDLERNKVFQIITEDLNRSHQYTACALLAAQIRITVDHNATERDYPFPRTAEVYDLYKEMVENPNTRRLIRKHLNDFEDFGFSTRHPNDPKGGGDNHELEYSISDVHDALEDFIADHIAPGVSTNPNEIPTTELNEIPAALHYLVHGWEEKENSS